MHLHETGPCPAVSVVGHVGIDVDSFCENVMEIHNCNRKDLKADFVDCGPLEFVQTQVVDEEVLVMRN